ncbi:MAG TPA: tetratricopeptide repeat protein, partial [Acetobacteraceae bacterium]|nr:tetratricopeptide repeat protein [Acetobacteraceae bacterium]
MVPSTDDRSILYLQGLRRLRAGDPRAAGALLTRCLDGNPTHQGARRNLIRALLASAEYERVLAQADIALEATPDNAELQFARGTALNGLGRPHEARDALTRATTLDPSHAAARLNLGNACVDQ